MSAKHLDGCDMTARRAVVLAWLNGTARWLRQEVKTAAAHGRLLCLTDEQVAELAHGFGLSAELVADEITGGVRPASVERLRPRLRVVDGGKAASKTDGID